MKIPSTLVLPALLLACVPASEERPPAGAAGFTTEPSAAARGEPLTTADGWTVTFEKVVLQASVEVYPVAGSDLERGFSGATDIWLWNGRRPVQIYARELGAGPWAIDVRLMSHHVDSQFDDGDDAPINIGVSPEDEARLRSHSDDYYGQAPSVLIAFRGQKAGRTVALDLSFSVIGTSISGGRARRVVRADSVALGPLAVKPEHLLRSEEGALDLLFEPIAAADANEDGKVTAAELRAAPARYIPDGAFRPARPLSLEDVLVFRCGSILVPE